MVGAWVRSCERRLAALGLSLLGCGLLDSTKPGTQAVPGGPDAGLDADSDASLDAAGTAGAAPDAKTGTPPEVSPCGSTWSSGGSPPNCAFPVPTDPDPALVDSVGSLTEEGCSYRLGPARELSVTGEFAFAFDVNGDTVQDLFFLSSPLVTVALSRVEGGEVSWDAEECDALSSLPFGRFFVRDLNHDNAPDLVVGAGDQYFSDWPSTGDPNFFAFVNTPQGFSRVFAHRFAERFSESTLWHVATADFDASGDCLDDVAFGYRRVFADGDTGAETGAMLLRSPGFSANEAEKWVMYFSSGFPVPDGPQPRGDLAAGAEHETPPLFVVRGASSPGDNDADQSFSGLLVQYEGADFEEHAVDTVTPEDPLASDSTEPLNVWIIPFDGIEHALVALQEREFVIHDLSDPGVSPLPIVYRHPLLGTHGWRPEFDHPPIANSFMLDIEGDGDLDFIEQVDDSLQEGAKMAIHVNQGGTRFSDGVLFEVSPHRNWWAEDPFVAVGAAQAAFVVDDRFPDGSAPTVRALECVPQ